MPAHPLAQVEGDDEAIRRDLPGFGQVAHDVHVLIVFDESVKDQPSDLVGCGIGGQQRDEVRGVADGALDDDVTVGGGGGGAPGGGAPRRLRAARRDGQKKKDDRNRKDAGEGSHGRQATVCTPLLQPEKKGDRLFKNVQIQGLRCFDPSINSGRARLTMTGRWPALSLPKGRIRERSGWAFFNSRLKA